MLIGQPGEWCNKSEPPRAGIQLLQVAASIMPSGAPGTTAAQGFISCEQIWQLFDLISPYKAVTLG